MRKLIRKIGLLRRYLAARRRGKRFNKTNYPVIKKRFPKGDVVVLIRNLKTHRYGGWLVSIKHAEKMFGKKVIEVLQEVPA